MDKNTIIGLTLLFVLFMVWQQFLAPSAAELEAEQRKQDSLTQLVQDSLERLNSAEATAVPSTTTSAETQVAESDSTKNVRLVSEFGPFANAAEGTETLHTLENDVLTVVFSTKGGIIKEATLKNHSRISENEKKKEIKEPLKLLEDDKNKFEYFLPIASLPSGGVKTSDLYFTPTTSGNTITFRADAGNGRYFEQKYTISENGKYQVNYDIKFEGLQNVLASNTDAITLNWVNYLDKLEKNTRYERNYSSAYYKLDEGSTGHCNCMKDDKENLTDKAVKWVAHSNQFFNTALIAEKPFTEAILETKGLDEDGPDLKLLTTEVKIPYGRGASETYAMNMYLGPNEFNRLRAIGYELENVVPFGRSIFGWINRWVIRPVFNFLSTFIGNKGIVILVLTLFVKLLLYPLTYKMLYSQSKMAALKPRMEGLKEKHKDNPQQVQVETMKIYREFGVNPLGGCMPMFLQMPIWIALYRFFPGAIEFRQASFLWATDLSSYDVIARLPFEVPLGFGSHISLFTLLWAVTTLIYTYYNTKHMDMSANPAMKYMQYVMPLFFMGFFNSFASGLTCYLFFSNLFNITQTLVTKNYIIDKDKINRELEAYRKKPKKKGGFQDRLATALQEQQKIQAQREAKGKKSRKK